MRGQPRGPPSLCPGNSAKLPSAHTPAEHCSPPPCSSFNGPHVGCWSASGFVRTQYQHSAMYLGVPGCLLAACAKSRRFSTNRYWGRRQPPCKRFSGHPFPLKGTRACLAKLKRLIPSTAFLYGLPSETSRAHDNAYPVGCLFTSNIDFVFPFLVSLVMMAFAGIQIPHLHELYGVRAGQCAFTVAGAVGLPQASGMARDADR
jgi:hypothetical protein